MNKILTIVVPTYNMEKFLRRCLDSLIINDESILQALEVLVINDGSKDMSSTIAHEYHYKYPNVFLVIDKENGNYGSCINRGIHDAKGRYFRILDADDWYDNDALKILIKELGNMSADVVFTRHRLVYSSGKIEDRPFGRMPCGVTKIDEFDFFSTKNSFLISMHSIAYRTDFLRATGLRHQEGISYTDNEFCYFPLTQADTFQYVDVCLYNYFLGREGQTVTKESEINHFDDFYLVCHRLVADFIGKASQFGKERKRILIEIISHPMANLLYIPLVYKKKTNLDHLSRMGEVVNMASGDKFLYSKILHTTYLKIPIVRLWKLLNFRLSWILGV